MKRHELLKKLVPGTIHSQIFTTYPNSNATSGTGSYFSCMNTFFQHWVDLTAMLLSLAATIFIAFRLARKNPVRSVAAFFLLFGPLVIGIHMFFHLFNITYNVTERIRVHSFIYDFRLYSLYLMGFLLGYLSLRLLRQGIYKCRVLGSSNTPIYKTMAAICLVSVPTVFFTPIGSLPAMACVISLVALRFLKRKRIAPAGTVMEPERKTALAI